MQLYKELDKIKLNKMQVNDSFGAFLRNYKPNKDINSFLDKYLIQEGFKHEGINSLAKKGNEVYLEALDRHFLRLSKFLDSENESIVNLVFGNVQSGKTGHLLANICWARDSKFHLAIILTGSITDLGEQTVDRLREKLPENTAFIINAPTESSLNFTILNSIIDKVQKRDESTSVPIPVITLIKSPARLAAVKRMLQELKQNLSLKLNVILLDDEAD